MIRQNVVKVKNYFGKFSKILISSSITNVIYTTWVLPNTVSSKFLSKSPLIINLMWHILQPNQEALGMDQIDGINSVYFCQERDVHYHKLDTKGHSSKYISSHSCDYNNNHITLLTKWHTNVPDTVMGLKMLGSRLARWTSSTEGNYSRYTPTTCSLACDETLHKMGWTRWERYCCRLFAHCQQRSNRKQRQYDNLGITPHC